MSPETRTEYSGKPMLRELMASQRPWEIPGPKKGGFHISSGEILSLLVSIVTLGLAFTSFFSFGPKLIIALILGFTFHELMHKFVAQYYGFSSEYRVWFIGLVLSITFAIISKGRFVFAAPGYVVTEGPATLEQQAKISLAGPGANLLIAAISMFINSNLAYTIAYVNIFLAAFNLLPFFPLDGAVVRKWNYNIWGTTFLLSLLVGFFIFMIRI